MTRIDPAQTFEVPEPPPEPQPWWRLSSRLRWFFGFERADLEVQAFAGVIYAAAEGYSKRIPELSVLAATLRNLRSSPDMPAALACERLYYEMLPPADLRAELWSLRERLKRVATDDANAAFATGRIVDVAAATDDQIVAEVRSILNYTHKSYHLTTIREVAAGRLKRWLLGSTVALILIFAALVWREAPALGLREMPSLFLGIGLIMLTGGVGAVMSVARRLQGAINSKVLKDDPLFEIAALELGRDGIMLSCLIGSTFALLVYAVLYGAIGAMLGLNGGFLVPNFSKDLLGQKPGLAHALALATDQDLARMLVISFVAGFAERLVPDSIDRILRQSAPAKK